MDTRFGFSASKGKYLTTPQGQLPFTNNEFQAYTALASVLLGAASSKWYILLRSGLSETELAALLKMPILAPEESSKDGSLTLYQNLILLKSIAHLQRLKQLRENVLIDDAFFSSMHDAGTDGTKQIAEFKLKRIDTNPAIPPLLRDTHEAYVCGYEVRAENYENAHVVYKIATTTTTTGKTSLVGSTGDSAPAVQKCEVTRRFKDFEFLIRMLQESAPGCIIPPLPCKSFVFNAVTDSLAMQRGRELTYFLSKLTEHPVLRESLSVKFFLEAPVDAFKAYRQILLPKPIVQATTQILSRATAAAETGFKQAGAMFSSFLGLMGKKVLDATEDYRKTTTSPEEQAANGPSAAAAALPPPPPSSFSSSSVTGVAAAAASMASLVSKDQRDRALAPLPPDAHMEIATMLTRLDDIAASADKCAALLDADAAVAMEEARLGGSCINLGSVGTEPCIDVQLSIAGESIEHIAALHANAIDIQRQICSTSYSFLGRYNASVQAASEAYGAARFDRAVAARNLQVKDDALRRAHDRYPLDSPEIVKATEEHRVAAEEALKNNEAEALALSRLQDDTQALSLYRVAMLKTVLVSLVEARQAEARDQADAWESLRAQLVGSHFDKKDVKSVPLAREEAFDSDLQRALAASMEGGGAGWNVVDSDLSSQEPPRAAVPTNQQQVQEQAQVAGDRPSLETVPITNASASAKEPFLPSAAGAAEEKEAAPEAATDFDPDNPLA